MFWKDLYQNYTYLTVSEDRTVEPLQDAGIDKK